MAHEPENASPRPRLASQPVTIKDIADVLGIHKGTVSKALAGKGTMSGAMRQRIEELAAELGYAPDPLAQRLATRSKNLSICLCSGALDLGRSTEKIVLLQNALTDLGLEAPLYTSAKASLGEAQATLFRQIRRQRPRAILLSVYALHDSVFPELEAYQREGGIVVSYDLPIDLDCDQVIFDREDNAYQGARYLLERGHRHLGIGMSSLERPRTGTHNMTQELRLRGYRRAMAEFHSALHAEWFFENPTYETGGSAMAQHFLELKERPTGLCIVNDYVAMAFMVDVMKSGVLVPRDVSVVGHDNQAIAAYCPAPLTSVTQPVEAIVRATTELLVSRLEGEAGPARKVFIRGEVVERASVAVLSR